MEYGLTECLRNYSGGLGVLSGDHLKSASDLGLPLVGIGLLYEEGYFHQYLNADGYQQQSYPINDYANQPVAVGTGRRRQAADHRGADAIPSRPRCRSGGCRWGASRFICWTRIFPKIAEEIRDLTDRLYGGDKRTRIRQEILLGIGGIQLLEKLNMRPTVCHMNEGHSAFLVLERIRLMMKDNPGLDFLAGGGYLLGGQHLHDAHARSRRAGTVWLRSDR